MVSLPATVAETPSISLPLQSKHLVCQRERKGAVQIHKAGEGPGRPVVSQRGLSNDSAVCIITVTHNSPRDTWSTESWVFGGLYCICQVAFEPLLLLAQNSAFSNLPSNLHSTSCLLASKTVSFLSPFQIYVVHVISCLY